MEYGNYSMLWLGGLAKVPDMTRGSYLFFLKPGYCRRISLFHTDPASNDVTAHGHYCNLWLGVS